MINKIDNINFESRFRLNGYSKHTPKAKEYDEFHFMPELKTKNQIKKFFLDMIENVKGIKNATKTEQNNAEKATGMILEA